MIDNELLREIVETYQKYGWLLRRIVHRDGDVSSFDFDVPSAVSVVDAAWFSRPPAPEAIAWELRYLGNPPFSLVEYLDEDDPDFEAHLRSVEMRLSESVGARQSA